MTTRLAAASALLFSLTTFACAQPAPADDETSTTSASLVLDATQPAPAHLVEDVCASLANAADACGLRLARPSCHVGLGARPASELARATSCASESCASMESCLAKTVAR